MVVKRVIIVSSIQSVEVLLSHHNKKLNEFLSSRAVTKMGSIVLTRSLMIVDFNIAS